LQRLDPNAGARVSAHTLNLVIAVDGPAASGKGTIASRLAAAFALPYLDTGLLYRAVGVQASDPSSPAAAIAAAQALDPASLEDPALRTRQAGEAASRVAAIPEVRAALLDFQRAFAAQASGAVLDGRDIGTVIAPHAPAKLFVTAAPNIRAERRWKQLSAQGEAVTLADVLADIRRRDQRDTARAEAPLVQAADAVLLDTTKLDIRASVDAACRIVEEARARWERS
jgi:cytidylate kinase